MWLKIEKILKEKNMTAYRLAKLTGISQQALYLLKVGKRKELSWTTMCKIADALEVDLNEFR